MGFRNSEMILCWSCTALLLIISGSAGADDGEGTARIVSPEKLVAGKMETVVIEYTVGDSGIAVGGGVSMGLHHAASWGPVQTAAPDRPGYITARASTTDNLEISWHVWAPAGMTKGAPSGRSDQIHHQVLVAKVTEEALKPGEKVSFILGANAHKIAVQKHTDRDHEFHITTDADGDGVYHGIAEQPVMDILPAPAHHFAAVAPAQIKTGNAFDLLIRAEDEFYNPASGFSGGVTVLDESGNVLTEAALKAGLATVSLPVDTPGPQRFRIAAENGLKGRSNPCRVMDTLPEYRIFWGDIHGHTSISDGLGNTAAEYYAFARDIAGLDVCALTDHGHFDWPQTIKAVKDFYAPGEFVTILAQESGAGPDHVNFYYRDPETPHIKGWPSEYGQLYNMIFDQYAAKAPGSIIAGPHHFSYPRGDDKYPFSIWDDRTARFIEVYSSHGTSEFLGNPRPCGASVDPRKFMQYGLEQGLRFGVIASSDNHDSHPGRTLWGHYPGGLAAFLAKDLSRESIWDAWWNYQVYAASFDRIYMEFTINGQMIGTDVKAGGPCAVAYYIIGKTDNLKVSLLRNNETIREDSTENGVIEVAFKDNPPEKENFYYLRVEEDNGERAWSTPIWVVKP